MLKIKVASLFLGHGVYSLSLVYIAYVCMGNVCDVAWAGLVSTSGVGDYWL